MGDSGGGVGSWSLLGWYLLGPAKHLLEGGAQGGRRRGSDGPRLPNEKPMAARLRPGVRISRVSQITPGQDVDAAKSGTKVVGPEVGELSSEHKWTQGHEQLWAFPTLSHCSAQGGILVPE